MSRLVIAAAFLAAGLPAPSPAASNSPLDQGYHAMYNLDFAGAHRIFQEWERLHPDDPMGPVSDAAAYLFSEFDRMRILQSELFVDNDNFFRQQRNWAPDPVAKKNFEDALARGTRLAAAVLARSPKDESALLANVIRIGLHCDYLAMVEKRNMAAFGEIKRGRAAAEKLLAAHPRCYDAYIAVGVENYMLSLKPAPVRWLLRLGGGQTDRKLGIERLKQAAEKGRYLAPYARLLLAVASLRDKDIDSARRTLEALSSEYPDNKLYREELLKLRSKNATARITDRKDPSLR